MISSVLSIAIVASTPLLLAVLGELVLERSGIVNIGLEGLMLAGAFSAVIAAQASGNVWIGFLGGIAGSLIAGVIFGLATIEMQSDQIIAGAAVNFLVLGITGVAARELGRAEILVRAVPAVGRWAVPGLGDLPVFGDLFFRYDPVAGASWLLMPAAIGALLWRSRAGLRLRATGEYPVALSSIGLSPQRYQWLALGVEILLAGVAGGYLALGLSSGFSENMTAGRGFIALAIVVFGRWSARGALAGVALFGLTAGVQYAIQASSSAFPFHLLLALPYVVTVVVLALFSRSVHPPEHLGRSLAEEQD